MTIHGVTDNDLYPARFGASQRLFGLLRGLARDHEVRALCVVPNRNRAPREQTAHGVRLLRRKAWYTSVTWRLERARLAPLMLAAHGHRACARGLLSHFGANPDVLMADLTVAGVLERGAARLRVYHAHNVESDHFRAAGPRLWLGRAWASHVLDLERRAAAAADLVVAASDEDGARFQELFGLDGRRVAVIPNGFDETEVRPPSPAERAAARTALGQTERDTVALFVGSNVPHNRAALRMLVERVMPSLAGAGVRLLVVGGVSRALAGRRETWLEARPEVADLLPMLHAADIGLNPVVSGGGSNVKLPTYLAAGLAVVSTPFGLRGFADLSPWVISAEPASFGAALAARPQGWHARGEAMPAPLAGYAWGGLGQRLGRCFAAKLSAGREHGTGDLGTPRRMAGAGGSRS
ncbi:MAG TPA: glycosyltransferase [Candidatus Limnocylindria bacterium]|nr:glycosyltransferase [Candidatus Limnocylindria bacterium]